jgi:two-component system chemotaxis response regulator CheY
MAKTILAVDDSACLRQMVAFTLEGAGYDVLDACDGVDGLNKARRPGSELARPGRRSCFRRG